ncbi:MAG: hypothetical protein JRE40_01465 [Deltaproteobacteria bacterium]|nr:hypothetical protein [Deltaproteobacteria bacterium]
MGETEQDILEVLEIYQKKLEQFKREMAKLGVEVKVEASLGVWTSTVEEIERDE